MNGFPTQFSKDYKQSEGGVDCAVPALKLEARLGGGDGLPVTSVL